MTVEIEKVVKATHVHWFRVIVTRDVTESATVVVVADDEEGACEEAERLALGGVVEWEYDVGSSGTLPPYITGCDEL